MPDNLWRGIEAEKEAARIAFLQSIHAVNYHKPPTGVKGWLRRYLAESTPRSLQPIADGVRGEFSKVREEYTELWDAQVQGNRKLTFIECCDLVDVSVAFSWKQFRVPAPVVFSLVYLRRLYKPVRNRLYDWVGLDKEYFNG